MNKFDKPVSFNDENNLNTCIYFTLMTSLFIKAAPEKYVWGERTVGRHFPPRPTTHTILKRN